MLFEIKLSYSITVIVIGINHAYSTIVIEIKYSCSTTVIEKFSTDAHQTQAVNQVLVCIIVEVLIIVLWAGVSMLDLQQRGLSHNHGKLHFFRLLLRLCLLGESGVRTPSMGDHVAIHPDVLRLKKMKS